VYFGGSFTTVDGSPRDNIARADAVSGDLDPWIAQATKSGGDFVEGLAVTSDHVFLGYSGSQHLDSYDPATGAQQWSVHTGGDVKEVAVWGTRLVFGGHFGSYKDVDGQGWNNARLACFDFTAHVCGDWFPFINGTWDGPYAFYPDGSGPGSHLWVGGAFKFLSGAPQHWLGRFTG
jgi:hypothetical protein